jgi:hypothetical protein
MAKLSSTDIALEGFRITRERPRIILAWAVVALLFSLASTAMLITMAGSAFMELKSLQTAAGSAPADPALVLSVFQRLAPAYGIILLLSLVYYAVLYAAGNRAVLRPEDRSFGYLSLGKAELLQAAAFFLLWLLFIGAYLGVAIPTILLSVVIGVLIKMPAIPFVLSFIVIICAMLWLFVRLSLTSAATFDTGRIGIGVSWRLTKGHFWPLLGAYVLAGVLLIVIALLTLVIIAALAAVLGGGLAAVGGMLNPNFSSLAAYLTPVILIQMVISAVVTAVSMAVMVCAPAYAYRQLRDQTGAGVAATFS